jgi:hypothetical protein
MVNHVILELNIQYRLLQIAYRLGKKLKKVKYFGNAGLETY